MAAKLASFPKVLQQTSILSVHLDEILRKFHYSQKYTMLQICGVAFAAGIVSIILFSNEYMLPCNHKDDIG